MPPFLIVASRGAAGTLLAGITLTVYPTSCSACGHETCDGGCVPQPAWHEERLGAAASRKAAQRSPRDTLPDYDDPEEDAAEADLDASQV